MKKYLSRPVLIALLVVLLISGIIGSALGKYIKTIYFPGQIVFSATLATGMKLQEHQVQRQEDGSYETTPVLLPGEGGNNGNNYVLMPGLDIPKDPFITVVEKTAIPAYLFVEVLDTTEATLSYALENHWLLLEGLTGKHGGAVYVYSTVNPVDARVPLAIDNTFPGTVNILKDDTVTVSQTLAHGADAGQLSFYACMGETALSQETNPIAQAKAVYNGIS